MNTKMKPPYGLMAEFESPEALLEAARNTYKAGYRRLDAFAPAPVEGLAEAIGFEHTRLATLTLIGGICGGLGAFGLQYYINVINFPLNIGGRPYNSWPAFIPVTFELTVLGAALATVVGLLALNGLPRPYHPVFNVPRFALATTDRFFLCVMAEDPKYDAVQTREFLAGLNSYGVYDMPE
jgi:Alternative complex III, ActD subunit